MKKRILLIVPPGEHPRQALGVKSHVNFGMQPPLGVGYIAAYLERDGHEVRILDGRASELTIEETTDRVLSYQPDLVGLSVVSSHAASSARLAERIRERLPKARILIGGPHANYFYDEILDRMPAVDHVLYGEVDTVVNDYVRRMDDPDRLRELKGLVYRQEDGRVTVNPPPDLIEDLDDIPMPAWHLYDMSLYRPVPFQYRQLPFFTMITSRGCTWARCKFCYQSGYMRPVYRRHSPKRVVQEMEFLRNNFGIKEISFFDDTFVVNAQWLKQFRALIKEKSLDITWQASARVNALDEEMLRTVAEAGCWSIFLGLESGNQDILDGIRKGITIEQSREALRLANKIGMETRVGFILGLPGDDPNKAKKTIDFAIEVNPTYVTFYLANPQRGTELYDMALSSGYFVDREFHNMGRVTYVPAGFQDAEQLSKTVRTAYRRFYMRPSYLWKRLRQARSVLDLLELIRGFILVATLGQFGRLVPAFKKIREDHEPSLRQDRD